MSAASKAGQPSAWDSEPWRILRLFRDATSGKLTCGAGRFLNTDVPRNGSVILDFNKSTNPLCRYNYAPH
jgi:uncharacterized protein (DUF1684 family)